ncbi:MAG: RNA polymerase sigma factor [Planctomycetota bacterium]
MPSPSAEDPTEHLLAHARSETPSSSQAWVQLLERCESKLRVLAEFRVRGASGGRPHDVDDLLQETWLQATSKIDDFEYRGTGSLQRWLASIMRFKILEGNRAEEKRPRPVSGLAANQDDQRSQLLEAFTRTQPGASYDTQRREAEVRVREVLDTLSEVHREALLLKIYEGKTGVEAAQQLGISESAFSKRFRQALAAVRIPLREDAS